MGQSPATHAKYKDAIAACDNVEYISYNVSQIATLFRVSPAGLANQLRRHYPEIIDRREAERQRLGIADNHHRGVRSWARQQYAEAVLHLRNSDDSVEETARKFNISFTGLKQHLDFYHKALVENRAEKRSDARGCKTPGALTGNGKKYRPTESLSAKYQPALEMYDTTSATLEEIARESNVTVNGLRNHLKRWKEDKMVAHRGYTVPDDTMTRLADTKKYRKSTAEKYAPAIARLKEQGGTVAEVARDFDLNPDVFREYLREHEPELTQALGRKTLENGRRVMSQCEEKYAEALRLFETTPTSLKAIAAQLGLQYNSLGGYIRRNFPEAIEVHRRLLRT